MHHTIVIPEVGKVCKAAASSDLSSNSIHSPHRLLPTTPHKRPISVLTPYPNPVLKPNNPTLPSPTTSRPIYLRLRLPFSANTISAVRHLVRLVLRRLRLRIRLLILLSFPILSFLLLVADRSLILNFLAAVAFSSALLLLLSLAFHFLPPFRLFLSRSSSLLPRLRRRHHSPHPVVWSIGGEGKEKGTSEKENWPATGSWVQLYSNGDVYEGEFHRGKNSGSGVYYYYMSGRYEGDWVDEKYDGYGVETWARGSRYRGHYRKGLRHGYGIYRFYTGDVYAGEWSNGQSHGSGVHTCEDGSLYVGEFRRGIKHGLGHYRFRNGDTFAGEYFGDKMHGFGVYRFANGHQYEGAWHEGRRQGFGMYTFRNGDSQAGHWQNGILDTLSAQNISFESTAFVDKSRVLNAVQEAQRAAQKASKVAKIDERVSKAVTSANKAANAARVAAVKAAQTRKPEKKECKLSQLPNSRGFEHCPAEQIN